MPHLPDRLIVFTRVPVPGRVKTRLIPVLGAQGAADLQRRMTEQVLQRSRHAARVGRLALEVRYDGGDQEAMSALYGSDLICREQGAEDLGERMHRAMADALAEGVGRVVLVGTDCPEIMPALLVQAFQALERHDLAIGPAADGG
jgi:rSAM/selenodomain-associated transferase 1